MARTDLRNPGNVDGDWFVDTRCIDCGTCRDIAPDLFVDSGGLTIVARQPSSADGVVAWLAAQACPTTSIGTLSRQPRPGRLYPREIEEGSGVFDCGYCAESSFGASAWFVRRAAGNVLVDSPRFTEALVRPIEDMGGLAHVVLTHRDDVADAARWADRFGARIWIHHSDRRAAPYATDIIEGEDDIEIFPGWVVIPTPGHTKGSVVYLLDGRYLFTGDSLAWSHADRDLATFRYACWYSWPAQRNSLDGLARRHRFEWVLPGHGARVHEDAAALNDRLSRLVARM